MSGADDLSGEFKRSFGGKKPQSCKHISHLILFVVTFIYQRRGILAKERLPHALNIFNWILLAFG